MATKTQNPESTLRLERYFSKPGIHPFDEVEWESRTAFIPGPPGEAPTFEQTNVEFPSFYSQQATNIIAQKYFAYDLDDPRRERSMKQLVGRVAGKIAREGVTHGYFSNEEEREVFEHELIAILLHQYAAFNSPVWFNVGVEGVPQQCSACFILSVEDSLDSILDWYRREGIIFKGGSGAGINLSVLRGSSESLSKGGRSSGPVTFMRAADANAGTITSGGRTRRAAKMVVLDIDHPDIEQFVLIKAEEEDRIEALSKMGYDMMINSRAGERNMAESTSYQNANNSVRITDAFMRAFEAGEEWALVGRITGEPVRKTDARGLMRLISKAAWRCADPGVQYDTTINDWHTTPNFGRINASNPCSEYMHVDDSSCNLASLNLLKFLKDDGSFDIEAFRHVTRIIFTAQDITIAFGDFPTEEIARNSKDMRQIGIGFANLGALLMAQGLAYDSDDGRAWAGAITALLTGESYLQSTYLAARVGPFVHYEGDAEGMQRVLKKHRGAARGLGAKYGEGDISKAAKQSWKEAVERCEEVGVRNAQASVLAPTGTISFLMDCDTTGIEPDFSLVKTKKLVGGGQIKMVNQTVRRALERLEYVPEQVEEIVAFIEEKNTPEGAPNLKEEHYTVFDCAVGDRAISYMGHIRMMAACQPFISGAISKTVNLPETATVEEIEKIYVEGWKMGLKAIAVYRDNCKTVQPLSADEKKDRDPSAEKAAEERLTSLLGDGLLRGERRRVSDDRRVVGRRFRIGGQGGYIHVGLFDDGRPGDLFVEVGKSASTIQGLINGWATTFSLALQHGTPLDILISKLAFEAFEPHGLTNDPNIRTAKSIVDYVVRWMAKEFLDPSTHEVLGIRGTQVEGVSETEEEESLEESGFQPKISLHSEVLPAKMKADIKITGTSEGICTICSGNLRRAGSCLVCEGCGTSTGCG